MKHKRKPGMLIATKARFPMGEGPNDRGLSRWHLIRECEASLKRKPLCAMSAVPTVL
jgi:aryl-alcohol dehydrogenase-like predicted oxidoreductase